jgi:hypothetical protein
LLLNSFQADQQGTFTTMQEFEEVLRNDSSSRIGDNFVDDILDSAWLKAVIKSLFPDSKEGSRQSGNRYMHTYIWSVNSFMTYQLVCNKSNTMSAASGTENT